MIENPELRAKILDWQKRYNIQDGDPAIALLELVQFMGAGGGSGGTVTRVESSDGAPIKADISAESLSDALKTTLLPLIDRMSFQAQEMQQKLDQMDFDRFVKQIETYHEGIDYCTKKLDVVKKETDALVLRIDKAAGQIKPITRGAITVLLLAAAVIGFVISQLWWH